MSDNKQADERSGMMSRRKFVSSAALTAATVTVLPRHVLGGVGYRAPSDTVNVAAIGAGGMGASNMNALTSQNIVAIADVDFGHVYSGLVDENGNVRENRRALKEAYDKAKRYDDWRVMLDQQKDIDAVVIATPDHVHAIAAKRAMEAGKHVYVQKPLTYTVREGRVLLDLARQNPKLVTQMGNQGHSGDHGRRVIELIRGGLLGPVKEVHVWTNRPVWPQGVPLPTQPVAAPSTMHWDLWKGPATVDWPYDPIYAHFNWRGWVPFGVGALGDMGAHLIDFPFWALEPGLPTRIETRSSPWGGDDNFWDGKPPATLGSYPLATVTYYEFGNAPGGPIKMTWYDGGLMPPTPPELPADKKLDPGGGVMYVGPKGKLIHETYGENPMLLPASLEAEANTIPQSLPRIEGGRNQHEMNWIRAILGQEDISCPFEYAVPLNETMILGMVALRAGQPIEYDGNNMRVTNVPEANQYLDREYRAGFELDARG